MHELTKKFVAALSELHESRDAEPLVELFGEEATLDKAGVPHGQHGRDGARTFWTQYRDVFDDLESSFSHTVTDDGSIPDQRDAPGRDVLDRPDVCVVPIEDIPPGRVTLIWDASVVDPGRDAFVAAALACADRTAGPARSPGE